MSVRIAVTLCASLAIIAESGLSSEIVCLKSGSCLSAESHTSQDQNYSFRIGSGTIELPVGDVADIEVVNLPTPSSPQSAPRLSNPTDPQMLVTNAADAAGVDRDFVRSVAKIESDFRQDAVSRKGAIGLMQIMPATAKELSVDAQKADANAMGGAKYLRTLLIKYHGNSALTLAAYNAGPGAVQKFGGVPPFDQTRSYILKVTREYDRRRAASARVNSPVPR